MGVLSWSPQEQMVLEFNGKDSRATTMQDDPVMGLADVQGLLELVLENPEPGTYQVYAGPGAAGAEIEWALKLTWEVARAGATVEETVHPNADACT